ncbi:MAG: AAA family ATPase [Sulfuricella sp.]|nr:AAA family ATPase [Sulfuricella sp.]
MEPTLAQQQTLIESLRRTLEQPVEVVETHISWVLLAGDYAYKIKKAVNLGFLDFGTLEKRRFYCAEELRLNRRLAPDLYLEVVPIAGSAEQPVLGGAGPAIEYAVKMRRFPQSAMLDQVLRRGELTAATIDAIARKIAGFHASIAVAGSDSPFGTAERVHQPVAENFAQIRAQRGGASHPELGELEQWSEREYRARQAAFAARKARGFIRECHGDLHLGNIVLIDGEVVPFDGIEFNENLRWIDIVSEAAFLAMDLQDRQQPRLARRFLNAYLERTGDYGGLEVLRYYLAYRAMVRAKVAAIRIAQSDPAGAEQEQLQNMLNGYIELAQGYTRPGKPFLAITHGLSGSGKTTATQALLEAMEVFRVRSDVERKRLYGLKPEAHSASRTGVGIYSPEATRRTYGKLAGLARDIVLSGFPVIVDAAFLKRRERAAFRELARQLGVPFAILDLTAPEQLLRQRVELRRQDGHDASEADIAVLESQLRFGEALEDDELTGAIPVDAERAIDAEEITKRLENLFPAASG